MITYGCQMNKSDSERASTLLKSLGFEQTDTEIGADFVLINTCSVRQSAEDRVFGKVRALADEKVASNSNMIIAVTGCMPGRDRDGAIRKRLREVDLYFPTDQMSQLPRWIAEIRPELVNSPDIADDYLKIKPDYQSTRQAFVSIQTGCNNFCTYCVVPFARGLEKNRPLTDVMEEIRDLVAHGCVEVTLLGQTVNSYQAPDPESFSIENPYTHHFAKLLWDVNQIPDVKRLHYTAPHPMEMTDEVIDAMTLSAHLNFLHIPMQSGDDEVLRRMNRRYTVEQFFDAVDRVKKRIPNIALGTDIIVGFSGETDEQFEKTVEAYKRADFDISYTARYSERSGTAAWRAFKDDVSTEEKKRRWKVLQDVMEEAVLRKNKRFVGEVVSVFVERHEAPKITDEMLKMPEKIQELIAAQPGFCYGNSREMKLVRFEGADDCIGEIVNVKITKSSLWVLEGDRV